MDHGRPQGFTLALGIGTAPGIWATLTVSGLTAFVTTYAGAIMLLKIFGALYLLWLANKAFRSAVNRPTNVVPKGTLGNSMYL